jgi:hypothetical protein
VRVLFMSDIEERRQRARRREATSAARAFLSRLPGWSLAGAVDGAELTALPPIDAAWAAFSRREAPVASRVGVEATETRVLAWFEEIRRSIDNPSECFLSFASAGLVDWCHVTADDADAWRTLWRRIPVHDLLLLDARRPESILGVSEEEHDYRAYLIPCAGLRGEVSPERGR